MGGKKEEGFKPSRGHGDEGRPCPYTVSGNQPGATPGTRNSNPVGEESAGVSPYKYWNEDALSRWLGMENLGWAILDGIRTQVLVDNGARVNSVTPAYVRQHNLGVHPISELDHSLNSYGDHIPLVGLGGGQAEPLGFTLMRVQIEGMPHYDEHQVLFILDNPSAFSARIPVILGTPTINQVVQDRTEIAPPATYTQVCKFLGATGYFHRFIKGYAKIAKPLNNLLQGENSKLKSHPVGLPPDALVAFQELKMKCLTVPVLAFMDFKKPFLLETDASIEDLGAVLSQEQDDGRYHPVAYASHGLKGGELKYHSSKLEFLALKWAMTEQFREYLQYQSFLVRTDNNPLTYVLTTSNLDAVGHRWVSAMVGYNFEIQYVRGLDNKVADALSRVGGCLDEDDVKELLDQSAIKELLSHAMCYGMPRAESDDPRVTQEHEKAEWEIIM